MFSLLVTVISVALVVALIAASLYQGGDVLAQGRTHTAAAELVNVAGQVTAGLYLRHAQGERLPANQVAPVASLGASFMRSAPSGWDVACGESVCRVEHALSADQVDVCLTVNEDAGLGRTLDLAVFDLVHAPYHCLERQDAQGSVTGYQFSYLYRR